MCTKHIVQVNDNNPTTEAQPFPIACVATRVTMWARQTLLPSGVSLESSPIAFYAPPKVSRFTRIYCALIIDDRGGHGSCPSISRLALKNSPGKSLVRSFECSEIQCALCWAGRAALICIFVSLVYLVSVYYNIRNAIKGICCGLQNAMIIH